MKQIVTTLLFLLAAFTAFSQPGRNSFAISPGLSVPAGQFAGTTVASNKAGFAKPGLQFNISFEHKLNSSLALSTMLYVQTNPLNTAALEKGYSSTTYFISFNPAKPIIFPNWKFAKKNWLSAGLLLGVSKEVSLNKKTDNLFFRLRSLAGISYVSMPRFYGTSIADTTRATAIQSGGSGTGLAYLLGIGLKYHYSKQFFLLFDIQYAGTGQVTFKNVSESFSGIITTNAPGSIQAWNSGRTGTTTRQIAAVHISAGAGIRF
jgi:hypothetical protein